MSVYANGRIIYGFVHTDDVFEAVYGDNEEGYASEELHQDLQEKHHITLESVGYAGVDILAAFSASASAKSMDVQTIDAENMAKTEEYKQNIIAFLRDIGVENPEQYTPQWYILGYMD